MKHGKAERDIIRQCLQEGTPFPDFIKEAPELAPGLEFFYIAYWDLAGDRAAAEMPIKWTAIARYCRYKRVLEDQASSLFFHIRKMDTEFLEYHSKKREARMNDNGKGKRVRKKS